MMSAKRTSKKSRVLILAAVPVAASVLSSRSVIGATQTWSGMNSNYIGTVNATASKSNWASPTVAAGSGSTSSNTNSGNTDLAMMPTTLSGANFSNPEPVYIATTSNSNQQWSIGGFDLFDPAGTNDNVTEYNLTNNNSNVPLQTTTLYLNGTTVGSTANTILADTTTSAATTLQIGNDLGSKPTSAPLDVVLGATTNNINVTTGNQIIIGSSVSEATAGSSFNVTGGGAFTLSGANTFSGGVIVNSSTLVAGYTGGASTSQSSTGTSASNVTLNSSTLGSLPNVISYIAGNVSVGTGSNIVAPGGNGSANIGTLAIGGTLSLNGSSTLDFDLAGRTADQLNLGQLSVTGTPTINIDNSSGPLQTFTLATYATNNSLSNSSFSFTNVPSGFTPEVTSTAIELVTTVVPANVTWSVAPVSGSVSGTWDTATGNWTGGNPVANLYKTGDTANFNDISGGSSGTIKIVAGGVAPTQTFVNNSNTSYTFTDADGTNGIGGPGTFTKSGSGTVTLGSPNSYGGSTIINGGTLIADGDAALGQASEGITLAGGTLVAGAAIGTAGTPSVRNITVNAGGGTFNTNGVTSVSSGSASINDVFNVTGSGGLELNGTVAFTANGALDIGSGSTVTVGGNSTSDTVTQINSSTYNGTLVVTNGARINFNTSSSASGTSTFSGSGQIDIAYGGTTESSTGAMSVVYTTYATGVTISNLKSTAGVSTQGGVVDVPIVLNSNNPSGTGFTPANVALPNASFVPGNFTVTMGGTTAADGLTINGVISGYSDVNIANGVTGGGAGTLVLGAQETYAGTTLFNAGGTVQLAVQNTLPEGTNLIFGTISGGEGANTTLDLDGSVQTISSLSSGQFGSATSETISNSSPNTATLVVDGSVTPANGFLGLITDGGLGETALVKAGTNTLTLSNTNAYSGGTTINGGELSISNDDNLGTPFGPLAFGGGTLGVTGAVSSFARPLVVNAAGGTIDVGSSGSYALTGPGSIAWNGGNLTVQDSGPATIGLTGATISVSSGSKLSVASGASVTVNGTTDPFTDSSNSASHVAIVNNGNVAVNDVNSSIAGITGTGSLSVGADGAPNTLHLATNSGASSVGSLTVGANSALDITNNHLFITYGTGPDPITSIAALLKSGYAGGNWNGKGINSSAVAANNSVSGNLLYGVGYADSNDTGNPAKLPSGTIEIKYTLLGDADLSGVVDGTDFGIVAANFNKGVSRWDQGDFNYDNVVDGTDFGDLAANFNKGVTGADVGEPAIDDPAIVAFAEANGLMSELQVNVPEPATVGLLAMGTIGILARRRRKASR